MTAKFNAFAHNTIMVDDPRDPSSDEMVYIVVRETRRKNDKVDEAAAKCVGGGLFENGFL